MRKDTDTACVEARVTPITTRDGFLEPGGLFFLACLRRSRSLAFRLARGLFVAIAGAYLLMVGAIWYGQAKIIFHPSRIVDVTPGDLGVKFDNVTLPLKGDQLAGWWVPAEDPQARTLLYLHGNAANVAANVHHVVRLRSTGLNVFIFDYRGYGYSTGGPTREKLLYEDAERAWKYLVAERNVASFRMAEDYPKIDLAPRRVRHFQAVIPLGETQTHPQDSKDSRSEVSHFSRQQESEPLFAQVMRHEAAGWGNGSSSLLDGWKRRL